MYVIDVALSAAKVGNAPRTTSVKPVVPASEKVFTVNVVGVAVLCKSADHNRIAGNCYGYTKKITRNTGHAWAEIWDGDMWVRLDATPPGGGEEEGEGEGEKKDPKDKLNEDADKANEELESQMDETDEDDRDDLEDNDYKDSEEQENKRTIG